MYATSTESCDEKTMLISSNSEKRYLYIFFSASFEVMFYIVHVWTLVMTHRKTGFNFKWHKCNFNYTLQLFRFFMEVFHVMLIFYKVKHKISEEKILLKRYEETFLEFGFFWTKLHKCVFWVNLICNCFRLNSG